jgi:hypothetical protein
MAALTANSKHININVLEVNGRRVRLFYSYSTVVGVQVGDESPIFTSERFSPTTARHIRKFHYEHGGSIVSPEELRAKLEQVGVRAQLSRWG